MGTLTSAPNNSFVMTMTTAGDSVAFVFPLERVRWILTTAVTSTWGLQMSQSSSVAGSTFAYPLLGSTAAVFAGISGSTVLLGPGGFMDFPIQKWVYGATLVAISGGYVELWKGSPADAWVLNKPYMPTTVLI